MFLGGVFLLKESFFPIVELIEDSIWSYFGFPLILLIGIYFTFRSGFAQIRYFPTVVKNFIELVMTKEKGSGIHPLKAFFACVGGCVGIGNVVGVCVAVQLGGPGALFWLWVTALFGMMLKYCEVYLGMKFRIKDGQGGYKGGPMYFLQKVFKTNFVPYIVCLLLCVYGVEVFQFSVVVNTIAHNFVVDKALVAGILVILVIYAALGGVKRVGSINAWIIPSFVVLYVGMGAYVFYQNFDAVPDVIARVISSAFTGHAALGGFIGSTLLGTISHGIRRASYSGDLGVGYASVIHSESSSHSPEKQASLVFFDLFLDSFIICTTTLFVILVTDAWYQPLDSTMIVQSALSNYFPYMNYFMPFFLFLLGYSTINAYFVVGLKCAEFVIGRWGKPIYIVFGAVTLFAFAFVDIYEAQMVMSLTNVLLLIVNSYGIFRLRKEISFNIKGASASVPEAKAIPAE